MLERLKKLFEAKEARKAELADKDVYKRQNLPLTNRVQKKGLGQLQGSNDLRITSVDIVLKYFDSRMETVAFMADH